jgi:outer membrane cobalamin receptor
MRKGGIMNHFFKSVFILVVVLFAVTSLHSEQQAEPSDAEMEQIWSKKVITPSKMEQTANEAPANITVITADELKKMGYHNFVDVLRDIVGMDVNNPGQGQMDFGLRGINETLSMGKYFQVLLDGYDMSWRQFYRNHVSTAWISLDAVERIEIIRGPSSALWGANACLGMINIITKSPERGEGMYASFTGGSFDTYSANGSIIQKIGNNASLSFFSSYYTDDIHRKVSEWSDVADSDVILNSNERANSNIYLKLNIGDFSLAGGLSSADSYQAISSFAVGADYTRFIMDKKFLVLGWEHRLNEDIQLKLSGYYDHYAWGKGAQYEDNPYNGVITDPGSPPLEGHFIRHMKGGDDVFGFKSQVNYSVSENLTFVGGFDYETRNFTRWYYPEVWAAVGLDTPEYKTNLWAVYLQGDYAPISWARINACLRHDVHSTYKSIDSPRIALVLTPQENVFIKFLYGTAFKAPSIHELYYFRQNAYYGNPTLKPEKNRTMEIQFGYKLKGRGEITASFFDVEMRDVIAYTQRPGSDPLISEDEFPLSQRPDGTTDYNQQDNIGHWKTRGIELTLKVLPFDNFTVFASGTYREAKDVDNDIRLNYTAEKSGAVGIRYNLKDRAFFTLQARYTGESLLPYTEFNEPGSPYQVLNDPTLSAPGYVTADFAVYFPEIMKGLDLTIRAVNLFDKDGYDAGREVLYSLPSRSIFVKLGYNF